MPRRIQGITIELDGETRGLEKALRGVNQKSRDLQKELKDVERLLKFDPGNVELLEQKQKLLGEQVETTTKKLDQLRKAEKQVQEQFARGDIKEEQYRAFQREIADTEASLRNFKKRASKAFDDIDSRKAVKEVGRVKKAFEKAGKAAKDFARENSGAMSAAGAAGVAAATGLVEGMQEYNQDLARLRTNASQSGQDLKVVEDAFKRITQVTGETDSAVETVSNLLASGFTDTQLASVIDEINGAAIRFSDTLKTEGIADGIQETFATGEAVGPFAELLERSGINLDDFNTQLKSMKDAGEGANFILNTLSDQGFAKVYDDYKKMNPEVQKNAEAQAEFQQASADLAKVLTPLIVDITNLVTKLTEFAANNPELVTGLVAFAGVIAVIFGAITLLVPVITALGVAAAALGIGILPLVGIIALVAAAIVALIAIGVWLWKNWDEIKEKSKEIWNNIVNWLVEKWDQIKAYAVEKWESIKKFLVETFQNLVNKAKQKFQDMKDTVKEKMDDALDSIKNIWDKVLKFFEDIDLKEIGKNIIQGLIDGVKSMAGSLIDSVKGQVGDAIEGAKNLLGIASPSKVFREIGEFTGEGFKLGLESMSKDIQRASRRMTTAAIPEHTPQIQPQTINNSPSITIQNMSVRDDNDINKIARELHNLTKQSSRRVGVI